jgi:CBS domain containing-hemolysin-like protein
MVAKLFDRETLLDLTVNIIPLVIIAFFVVAYVFMSPFETNPLTTAVQFGLLVVPFVLLAVLTYISGRAIAGSEQHVDQYLPGQASMADAEPIEKAPQNTSEDDTDAELESPSSDQAVETEPEPEPESELHTDRNTS